MGVRALRLTFLEHEPLMPVVAVVVAGWGTVLVVLVAGAMLVLRVLQIRVVEAALVVRAAQAS
jgi:hypothetical protein